jgi:mono/diheme cytochrome c family protein
MPIGRQHRNPLPLLLAAMACLVASVGPASAAATSTIAKSKDALTFEKDIRPILKSQCFQCHGEGEKLKGGLDLRLRHLIAKGGESGPAFKPGNRNQSLLYSQVHTGEMPKGEKKLSKDQVDLIGRWIDAGAKTARTEPASVAEAPFITEEERAYWAFQPIRQPTVPKAKPADRVRTPVDAFLVDAMRSKKLSFSPDADARTLIRRATFDLTGLPPTPEEVQEFAADRSPDAYERLIDRLLASPHYGERWGRHWLDVAGYADSDGYTNEDPVRKYAHKYRDYVIRAFNQDKPWDQFIREQLAGDELVKAPRANLAGDEIEKLVATGYLRMAPDGTSSGGVDQNAARNQVVADTLKIVSTSLLGLTVGCAQCHDHRYDPIPQADYYRMRAIFEPAYDWKNWRTPQGRLISLYTDADREAAKKIDAEAAVVDKERLTKQSNYIQVTFEKELAKLPEALREPIREARGTPVAKQSSEQKKLLKENPSVNVSAGSLYLYDKKAADDLKKDVDKATAIRSKKPVEDFVQALTEVPGKIPVTYLFNRGEPDQPKATQAPGDLTVLARADLPVKDAALPSSGRRLAYAKTLTDGTHPLTARVLVNRVWLHHFGKGIVTSPGDFGRLGQPPTHPELLDWLANDFMANGWQLKRLHKLIMTSTAYRQASWRDPKKERVDGDDRYYWRMPVRRLEAEEVRDAILAVSGKLNRQMFGEPVPVKEDDVGQFVLGIENKDGENKPGAEIPLNGQENRRSLYVQMRRTRPLAMLDTFDAPVMEPNCEARSASTVAPQSLMLLNNSFVVAQAGVFAGRVQQEAGPDLEAQIRRAWALAFGQEPAVKDVAAARAFIDRQTGHFTSSAPVVTPVADKTKAAPPPPNPQAQAVATFCQALLSANGFLYID